jgi:hypothetical protein
MSGQALQILGSLGEAPQQSQSSGGGAGGSGSQAAGQETAAGGGNAGVAGAVGAFSGGLGNKQNLASENLIAQDAAAAAAAAVSIVDGLTTWDAIRTTLSGQAFYFSGDLPITCGGACLSAGGTPYGALQLQVDFNNRTLGGTGLTNPFNGRNDSYIHVHGLFSNPAVTTGADTVEQTISQMSFSALPGGSPAAIVLNVGNLGATTDSSGQLNTGNFIGSTVELLNAGGVVAKQAQTSLVFSGTNTLSTPMAAAGTFIAPR